MVSPEPPLSSLTPPPPLFPGVRGHICYAGYSTPNAYCAQFMQSEGQTVHEPKVC